MKKIVFSGILSCILCFLCACGGDYQEIPCHRCKDIPEIQNRLQFEIKFPKNLNSISQPNTEILYYSTAVPISGKDANGVSHPHPIRTGYSICLNYKSDKSLPYAAIELRGIDLSRAAQGGDAYVKAEDYNPEYEDLTVQPQIITCGKKTVRYYAFKQHYFTAQELAKIKGPSSVPHDLASSSETNTGLFQNFYAYWMDRNIRYSIKLHNFTAATNQNTLQQCIENAKKYFCEF